MGAIISGSVSASKGCFVTKDHQLGGLTQKVILSQSGGQKFQIKVSRGFCPSLRREEASCFTQLLAAPGSLGLRLMWALRLGWAQAQDAHWPAGGWRPGWYVGGQGRWDQGGAGDPQDLIPA